MVLTMKIKDRVSKVSTFRERLKEAMDLKKMTQADLAKATGLNKGGISNYVLGRYEPKAEIISKLAAALDCSESWLRGYDSPRRRRQDYTIYDDDFASCTEEEPFISEINEYLDTMTFDERNWVLQQLKEYDTNNSILPFPTQKKLPLLRTIACGQPIFTEKNIEGYCNCLDNIHADFGLRCKGDSMIGARIHDGDIVYIRQQPDIENGEIAAVLIDDEATLKRVYKSGDSIILQPENPAYAPRVFVREEINQIRILGKAVCFLSKVK